MSGKIRRRSFIGSVGATAGTALLVDPFTGREAGAASATVYSAHHANLVSGSTPSTVQEDWVQAALDACVKEMTGTSSVGAAWEAIFAGVKTSSKVAIKINCLKKQVSPQLATIKALVKGMIRMCGGAFPAKNISLFDNTMKFSGLSGSNRMAAVYGASNLSALGITFADPSPQYAFKNYMKANLHLYVADMLFAAKTENASGWSKLVKRITISKDPCAMDAYFADVLNGVGLSGTKAVPQALAKAGIGNASYNLKQPKVVLGGGPTAPTRDALDGKIRDHRDGKAQDGDVKALIKPYRGK